MSEQQKEMRGKWSKKRQKKKRMNKEPSFRRQLLFPSSLSLFFCFFSDDVRSLDSRGSCSAHLVLIPLCFHFLLFSSHFFPLFLFSPFSICTHPTHCLSCLFFLSFFSLFKLLPLVCKEFVPASLCHFSCLEDWENPSVHSHTDSSTKMRFNLNCSQFSPFKSFILISFFFLLFFHSNSFSFPSSSFIPILRSFFIQSCLFSSNFDWSKCRKWESRTKIITHSFSFIRGEKSHVFNEMLITKWGEIFFPEKKVLLINISVGKEMQCNYWFTKNTLPLFTLKLS